MSLRPALLLAAIAVASTAVMAADPPSAPAASPEIRDRLFIAFSQEAALVPSQWWEGQLEYVDGGDDVPVDVFVLRGVVAFHPIKSLEVGGRVGFGTTHAQGALPDGTGATDLEAYGKWVFQNVGDGLDFAAGALVVVPTGDDTAGLGFNSFSVQGFGSVSWRTKDIELGGHVGVRLNDDGKFLGSDLTGKTSFEAAFSVLFPLANQVSLVGEARFESDRFEEINEEAELLGGINWRAFNRGTFRGAIAGGLTDGSPNFRFIASYAYSF